MPNSKRPRKLRPSQSATQIIRTSPVPAPELISSERPQAATPEPSEGQIETPVPITALTAATGEKRQIRQPVDSAIREIVADMLREQPLASHSDIAAQVGVSRDFVTALAKKLNSGGDELADKRIRSYQRQIGKALPIAERVRVYAEIVKGEAEPKGAFSQLSALKRVEELEGIVTAKERRESADNSVPQLPAMFSLPSDGNADIGIAIRVRRK